MRLIDADWVLGHLKPYEPSDEEWIVTGGTALRLIHNAVDNAPTVDAVIVTRCKNCRSYNKPKTGWCEIHLDREHPDDFCSYGKRKDGGDG
nr:MAG TPA: baseplate protein [Caudoviricetes sp.]